VVVHGLLAGEHRLGRGRRAGAAGGRGAQLGHLALVLGEDGIAGLALGADLLAVGHQLVGRQVALLGGGAFEDLVGRGPRRGALLAQLVE
jgi:hypothetical protein